MAMTIPDLNAVAPFLIGFVTALLLVALLGRRSAAFLSPLVRLLRGPGRLARGLWRFLRRSPRAAVARSAAVSGKAEIDRLLQHEHLTEVERALRTTVTHDEGGEPQVELYDFREENALMQRKGGLVFRSVRVHNEGYIPDSLQQKMTDAVAEQYVREASRFFNSSVALQVNEKSLYEDAEAGVIVRLFQGSDRRCFYALNEMRKTINGNIRGLTWVYCALLFASAIALIWLLRGETIASWRQWALPAAAVAAASWLIMLTAQSNGYKVQQEHSTREMSWFLSRWLDRVNDRFRDATTHAMGVSVGEEKDTDKIAAAARKWHKIMMWTAMRSFFIEGFYRNIRFQIDRNRTYYAAVPLIAFGLAAALLAWVMVSPALRPADVAASAALGALVLGIGILNLDIYHRPVIDRELNESKWLGYGNLEVSKAMDDVVGKYGEEVGYWKNRFDR